MSERKNARPRRRTSKSDVTGAVRSASPRRQAARQKLFWCEKMAGPGTVKPEPRRDMEEQIQRLPTSLVGVIT